MIQLDPPIPVWIPGEQQPGEAVALIDYSPEHDTIWKVILRDGRIWDYPQPKVRGRENVTLGRLAQKGMTHGASVHGGHAEQERAHG